MKFLFYTDIHFSGKPPRHRVDDYPQTMLEKMREIYQIAEDQQCDFVTFGGDLYNSHLVYSYSVIGSVIEILENTPLTTYCIIGQHDLRGYNPDSLKSSVCWFTISCCSKLVYLENSIDVGSVTLHPSHVWGDPLEDCKQQVNESQTNVMLAHHLLTKDTGAFEMTQTKSLDGCTMDFVLSGDLHTGFPTHRVGKTTFANPGAIARQKTNDAGREPKVLIVDTESGLIEEVKLQTAKDGSEVFNVALFEELRETAEMDQSGFIDEVAKFEHEAVDAFELIEFAAKKQGLADKVLRYILSKKKAS